MHISLPDVRVFILKEIVGSYIRFATGPKIAGSYITFASGPKIAQYSILAPIEDQVCTYILLQLYLNQSKQCGSKIAAFWTLFGTLLTSISFR